MTGDMFAFLILHTPHQVSFFTGRQIRIIVFFQDFLILPCAQRIKLEFFHHALSITDEKNEEK